CTSGGTRWPGGGSSAAIRRALRTAIGPAVDSTLTPSEVGEEIVVAWWVMNVQPVAPSATVAPRATAAMRRGAMDAAEREFTDPPGVQRVSSTSLVGRLTRSETLRTASRGASARTLVHIRCGILEIAERTRFYAF